MLMTYIITLRQKEFEPFDVEMDAWEKKVKMIGSPRSYFLNFGGHMASSQASDLIPTNGRGYTVLHFQC